MRFFKHITLAVALLTASTLPLSAKSTQASKAYMFGFSASFNDSIVYFTDIQEVDSVWTNGKGRFLAGRNQYSYQLREYFTTKLGMARRTCVVVSSLKRKDVEKKYAKMKKQYIENWNPIAISKKPIYDRLTATSNMFSRASMQKSTPKWYKKLCKD